VPCYNEAGNIERVAENILSVLPELSEDFEIIIVNDGSVDRTGEIADRLAAAHRQVRVIHHQENRG